MKIITSKNIFHEGVLVSLRTRCWGASGQLESDQYDVKDKNITEEQIKAIIDLIDDMTIIKDMRKIRNQAKNYISKKSIPSKVRGLDFIAISSIESVDQKLTEFQNQYLKLKRKLIKKLSKLKAEFKNNHPSIYNENDYPTEEQLERTIKFDYIFRSFEPPNKDILPQGMYKEELKKFKQDINSMKEDCTNLVKNEIVEKLKTLNSQIENNKKNKIHKSTLKSIENMIDSFNDLWSGFIDNNAIKKVMKDIKSTFNSIDIEDRDKEGFSDEMKELVNNTVSKLKKDKFFRAIDL